MLITLAKIYFVIFGVVLVCKFLRNFFYLYKEKKLLQISHTLQHSSTRIIIFMPLLNEMRNFNKMIYRFRPIINKFENLSLVFVTTARETQSYTDGKNTIALVNEFIGTLGQIESKKYQHIHYPRINLSLAEQLNFALEIVSTQQRDVIKTFYGFYNVDSNVNSRTIDCLLAMIDNSQQKIFQQSSTFLQNHNEFRGVSGVFLRANGLRQTRWTFLHEIPRYIKNSSDNLSLVHCVTHGLFVEAATMKHLGFFPTDSFGEDLYFGFIARAYGYTVQSIPILEESDTPSNFASMLRQKYVWFWGPLGYFYYWLRLKRKIPKVWKEHKKMIIATTIFGISDALSWLLAGWAFIIFFVCAYLLDKTMTASILGLGYLWISTFLSGYMYNAFTVDDTKKLSSIQLAVSMIIYPLVVFIHGLPPLFTIAKQIQLIIYPVSYLRPKTESN